MFTQEAVGMAREKKRQRVEQEPTLGILTALIKQEARKVWHECVDCGTRFRAQVSGCSCPYCGMVHSVRVEGDENSDCKTTAELHQCDCGK